MISVNFKILGAVIAGGLSRRMRGQDKPWLELRGEPLIMRAARRLSRQTGSVILNVNRQDNRLREIDLPVVPDLSGDYQGPLAGVAASLHWTHENRPDITHVIGASVDSPFFPEDLVSRLTADIVDRPGEIAIAFSEDYPQPVFGLWPVACLEPLNSFLREAGNLKVMAFVRSQSWRRVDFPPSNPPAFFNINTPDELAIARELLAEEMAKK